MKVKIQNQGNKSKGKCYNRTVTSVDVTKTNGYAFTGEFLQDGEHDLEIGTVVLQIEAGGSYRHPETEAVVYRVQKNGELVEFARLNYKTQFISLRDEIANLLNQKPNPLAGFTDQQIRDEMLRRGLNLQ